MAGGHPLQGRDQGRPEGESSWCWQWHHHRRQACGGSVSIPTRGGAQCTPEWRRPKQNSKWTYLGVILNCKWAYLGVILNSCRGILHSLNWRFITINNLYRRGSYFPWGKQTEVYGGSQKVVFIIWTSLYSC